MKSKFLLILMISIISDISAAARSGEVPPGLVLHADPRPLPPVRFVAKDGSIGSLSDFRGQTVLLNIWATWCPPCREEMRSEEHTSELQSLMRISYAVFCLKKKKKTQNI